MTLNLVRTSVVRWAGLSLGGRVGMGVAAVSRVGVGVRVTGVSRGWWEV